MARPERLRSVREWLVRRLRRTDGTIAERERQEVAAVRAAHTLPRTSNCRMAGRHTRPMAREQARRAIAEDGMAACPYHRPDTELGAP